MNANSLIDRPETAWVALVVATAVAWVLGHEGGVQSVIASSALLVAAFIKVGIIGRNFMELGSAPGLLRLAFAVYCTCTCVLLIGFLLSGA